MKYNFTSELKKDGFVPQAHMYSVANIWCGNNIKGTPHGTELSVSKTFWPLAVGNSSQAAMCHVHLLKSSYFLFDLTST